MVPDGMSGRGHPPHQVRIARRIFADHEKGRPRTVAGQDVEKPRRVDGMRAIVECQRRHRLLGFDMRDRAHRGAHCAAHEPLRDAQPEPHHARGKSRGRHDGVACHVKSAVHGI